MSPTESPTASPDSAAGRTSGPVPRRAILPGPSARAWAVTGAVLLVAGVLWAVGMLIGSAVVRTLHDHVPTGYVHTAMAGGATLLGLYAATLAAYLVRIAAEARHGYRTTWEGSYWSETWRYLDTVDGRSGAVLLSADPLRSVRDLDDVRPLVARARAQSPAGPRPVLRGEAKAAARREATARREAYTRSRTVASAHRRTPGTVQEWADRIGTTAALTVVRANALRRRAWLLCCVAGLALFVVVPVADEDRTWGWTVIAPELALLAVTLLCACYAARERRAARRATALHLHGNGPAPRPADGGRDLVPAVLLSSPDAFDLVRDRVRLSYRVPEPEPVA